MKLSTYIFFTVGLIALFNLAGLQTTTGWLLGQVGINIGDIQNFEATPFYIAIFVALSALITVTGIRIGTWGGAPTSDVGYSAIAALVFAALIGDLVSIVKTSTVGGNTWVGYVVFLIMLPLIFGYALSLYNWARKGE